MTEFEIDGQEYQIRFDDMDECVQFAKKNGSGSFPFVFEEYCQDIKGAGQSEIFENIDEFYEHFLGKVNNYLFENHGEEIPDIPPEDQIVARVKWIAENGLYLDGLQVKVKEDI